MTSVSSTKSVVHRPITRDELIDRACPATAFVLQPRCTFDDSDPFTIHIVFDYDLFISGPTPVVIRGHSVDPFNNFVLAVRWHALHRLLDPDDHDRFQAIIRYLGNCPKAYRSRPTDMIQRGLQGLIGRGIIHGPWNRPLNDAAMQQNAEARYNRKLEEVAIALGEYMPQDVRLTPDLVRHGDTYSDLFGTRSLEDDCLVSYARRHGSDFVADFEALHNLHNGHEYRGNHRYTNTSNRNLVEIRQARALAGLSTQRMDEEILRRVGGYPMQWGWLGRFVANASWTCGVSYTTCNVLSPCEQDENRQYVNNCAADFQDRERRRMIAELETERLDWSRLRVEAERNTSRGTRLGRMIHGNTL